MHIHEKVRIIERKGVYPPLEDSILLAEAVENHAFGKVLDLGTGSGIQGIVAAKRSCDVTFADIDKAALECAKANARLNGVEGKFIQTNLFSKVKGKYNTIIFNPPYLPSGQEMKLVKALDGGINGREIIDRFLGEYEDHLLSDHTVLMIESSLNNYESDVKRLKAQVVGRTHYFFEDIVALKF